MKSELLLLFDVLLDVEISDLCLDEFWPEEDPNLDNFMFEGRGGGIKALAEICLYKKKGEDYIFNNREYWELKQTQIITLTADLIFFVTGHARHAFPRSTRSLLSVTNRKFYTLV